MPEGRGKAGLGHELGGGDGDADRFGVVGLVVDGSMERDQAALEIVDAVRVAGDDFDGIEDHAADWEPVGNSLAGEVAVGVDAHEHTFGLAHVHDRTIAREEVHPLAQNRGDVEGSS